MKKTLILLITSALSACTVGPDYAAPALDLPEWWHNSEAQKTPDGKNWWTNFHDEKLNELIDQALKSNHTVKIAEARIAEARASREQTASGLYPQISANANSTRGNQTTAQSAAFIPPGLASSSDNPKPVTVSQATFDASWELDLFGGTRRQIEAANATTEVYEARLQDAQLTLIGDVAREYFTWRQLQAQEDIARKTSKAQKGLFAIAERKYKAGTGSRFEAAQADALYSTTDARLPELTRQKEATGYRLSLLIGEPAGALNERLKEPKTLPQPTAIPTLASPADTIRNRLDVRAAERQLAASTALQGAALAEAFPKISLSTLFGVLDTSLSDPVRIWSYTGGIAAPLLTFGRIEGGIKAADARQQQAFHQYQQAVLQAVADIETQLSNIAQANTRVIKLRQASRSAADAEKMARERYSHGISSFTDVLNAEQQSLNADTDLTNAEADRLNYLVALHKALGMAPLVKDREELQ